MALRLLNPVCEFDTIRVTERGDADSLSREEAAALINSRASFGCPNPREWFHFTGTDTVRAGGWVGVIGVGEVQVTVFPKIEGTQQRLDLVKLLVGAGWLDESFWGSTLMSEDSSLLTLFAQLFAKRLSSEVSRGLPRRYIERSDTLTTLKGRLNLNQQINLMAGGQAMLACDYDSFEFDTAVNQALKAGLTKAISLMDEPALRLRLRNLRDLLDGVSDKDVRPEDVDLIVLGRNEVRLKPLLSIAKLFLRAKSPQIRGTETGAHSFGLMFSMWKLFEEFTLMRLNHELSQISDDHVQYYARGQESDRRIACYQAGTEIQSAFAVKPDILVYRKTKTEEVPVLIADTKWKDLEEEDADKTLGVSQGDVYQLFAYSHLYTAPGQKPLPLALLYPQVGNPNGELPGKSSSDKLLGVLGNPKRSFFLDCKSDQALDGIRLDIFDFPLPSMEE